MIRQSLVLCLGFIFVLIFSEKAHSQKEIPELWGQRVHDEAKALSQQTVDNLEQKLKVFEDSTTNQIAILIVPSLDGEVIEQYALRVAEKWKLGQKERDNGAVLVIAINDRKMRIEVGQGLEGPLPDALCSRIIRNEMAPLFRRGDYDGGVTAAIDAIMQAIKGEYKADDAPLTKNNGGGGVVFGLLILVVLGIFTYTALFTKGCAGWGLYAFLSPFYAIFPAAAIGAGSGLTILLVYLIGFPILKLILGRSAWGQRIAQQMAESAQKNRSGRGWSSGGGWFMGGGGGWGGGGGGGFSGGGGSFGGGGSSGSW